MFQTFLINGKNKRYAMIKIGNFEIEYDRNAPERVAVKIETDKNGEVWLSKCDIARAYDVFVQSVNAGLKSLAKTGDFDEYTDVRVEHFIYNGKNCSTDEKIREDMKVLASKLTSIEDVALKSNVI